jgi:hypothetical protein
VKEYNAQMMEIKAFCDEVNTFISVAPSAEMLDE